MKIRPKIKLSDVRRYQKERQKISTMGEFKKLGAKLRDEFGLTSLEAIQILNGNAEAILSILEKYGD